MADSQQARERLAEKYGMPLVYKLINIVTSRMDMVAGQRRFVDGEGAHAEITALLDEYAAALVESQAQERDALLAERDTLREALRPFGTGVEAFDNADGTYGDGPVFERLAGDAHWRFTIADARCAAAVLAEVPASEPTEGE